MQMRKTGAYSMTLVALALFTTTALAAMQQAAAARLTVGRWTGTVIAENDTNAFGLEVAYRGDTLSLVLIPIAPPGVTSSGVPLRINAVNARFSGDSLRFVLQPPDAGGGQSIPCVLLRKTDRSLAGTCTGPQGQLANMTARPPG